MFYGALLTFATSILLPHFVKDPNSRPRAMESMSFGAEADSEITQQVPNRKRFTIGLSLCWQLSHAMFGLLLLSTGCVYVCSEKWPPER